jgi:tetratricopeptide (TPR) repeat protein
MIPQEWLQYAPKPRDLKPGEEWNVFLSYRSVNRTWVLNLYDTLVEMGFKVFIDQAELVVGDQLVSRLGQALRKSQAGVLIWSAAAAESTWVETEYVRLETKAINDTTFRFVPVKLDKTELPEFADSRIFVDFSSYPDGPNGGELLRLLYGICGKSLTPEAVRFANKQNEAAIEMINGIEAAKKNSDAEEIIRLFAENSVPWKTSAALGCKAAETLTKLKKNNEALEILEKVSEQFPRAIRPKQLHALALARRGGDGDLKTAQRILGKLYAAGERDPETLGIYGRTWMDRYAKSNDISDLVQSRDLYAEAFDKAPDDYYTGINAAAKSVFIGTPEDLQKANEYAIKVEEITGIEAVAGDYWKTATIGENFLIQKKYAAAAEMYKKAVAMARTERASHETTFTQAKRLMEKLQPTDEERKMIEDVFKHLI